MTEDVDDSEIERFLDGAMSSREESGFYLRMAVDPSLRVRLRGARIVRAAVEKDRAAIPPPERSSSSAVLASYNTSLRLRPAACVAPTSGAGKLAWIPWASGAVIGMAALAIGIAIGSGDWLDAPTPEHERSSSASASAPPAAGEAQTGDYSQRPSTTSPQQQSDRPLWQMGPKVASPSRSGVGEPVRAATSRNADRLTTPTALRQETGRSDSTASEHRQPQTRSAITLPVEGPIRAQADDTLRMRMTVDVDTVVEGDRR